MENHHEDDDLEPFLSEVRDEAMPPRWRLGSLLYLEARETFLSPEQRDVLKAAREGICRALAAEAHPNGIGRQAVSPAPPRVQGTLFCADPEP